MYQQCYNKKGYRGKGEIVGRGGVNTATIIMCNVIIIIVVVSCR